MNAVIVKPFVAVFNDFFVKLVQSISAANCVPYNGPKNVPLLSAQVRGSPQLECWNAGIVEKWVLGYWKVGLTATFVLTIILKRDNII